MTLYVRGAGMRLARIEVDAVALTYTRTYLHPDQLGSATAGTSQSGAVLWREQYAPYGDKLTAPTANDDLGSFTGHIDDDATTDMNLTYMQARYYDPGAGRFTSTDPVTFLDTGTPGMVNRYAYTMGDPVNMVDPDGQCSGAVYGSSGGVNEFCTGLADGLVGSYYGAYGSLASFGVFGSKAANRAQLVGRAIDTGATLFINNSKSVSELVYANLVDQGIAYHAGNFVGAAAPAIAITRGLGASTSASAGIGASNGLLARYGGAYAAVDGFLKEAEAAGFDTSEINNDLLGNVALAGAAGGQVNYDSGTGSVTVTFSQGQTATGSRIKRVVTEEIGQLKENE